MAKQNWYDRVTTQFVEGVANKYIQDVGIPAFDIFPQLPSKKLKGKIALYDKADWFYIGTVSDYIRRGAAESAGDDYTTSSQSYELDKYSFHKDITEDEANEYDNPFNPVQDAVQFVINRIRRVITLYLVQSYLTTGIWSADKVGTTHFTKWSDSSSNPVSDVLTWKEAVLKTTGFKPNRLLVTPDIDRTLRTNTAVINLMKVTETKIVTNALIATLFDVEDYNVIDTVNSAGTDFMATNKLLLVHTPKKPSMIEPSAGYTIVYRGENLQMAPTTRIPMLTKNNALRIETDIHAKPLVLASDLGIYAYNVIA